MTGSTRDKFSTDYAEDKVIAFDGPEKIDPGLLQSFAFNSPRQFITTETREFSAVCPFSGLPDYGSLKIEYRPTGGKCVELKSLKYYLISFRSVGVFQEEATRRVREDLEKLLECPVRVTTVYNPRGGFDTTCVEGTLNDADQE